ncbi:MAG: hypothetical protein QXO70_00555 [Candidatus Pacearchaeota archaeon]
MFDYNKVYFKVMNDKETHYGFKYKDGLNILQEKFDDNPKHSCCAGGLYFTDYKNLHLFINMITDATYIREVTIPTDAKVVLDLEGDKWRADKIILNKRYHLWDDFDKWFDPVRWNWEEGSGVLVRLFNHHFDKWWDAERFNWEEECYLEKYCQQYKEIWGNNKH